MAGDAMLIGAHYRSVLDPTLVTFQISFDKAAEAACPA